MNLNYPEGPYNKALLPGNSMKGKTLELHQCEHLLLVLNGDKCEHWLFLLFEYGLWLDPLLLRKVLLHALLLLLFFSRLFHTFPFQVKPTSGCVYNSQYSKWKQTSRKEDPMNPWRWARVASTPLNNHRLGPLVGASKTTKQKHTEIITFGDAQGRAKAQEGQCWGVKSKTAG